MAIYLDPAVWRRGHGRELMSWAKDLARARGWARMTLWVLRDNAPARRFYEAEGFRADGQARDKAIGGAAIAELRYVWSRGS
jgi:GNAT superfamily N-acetyltransferase